MDPHIPSSDDDDPEVRSTPAGLVDAIEDEIEDTGATVGDEQD